MNSRSWGAHALSLFRVAIPAWRFFDEPGLNPRLFFRLKNQGSEYGDWKSIESTGRRRPWMLFLNASANLRLLERGLLERSIEEISELSDEALNRYSDTASYELLRRICERHLRLSALNKGVSYQFKITDFSDGATTSGVDVLVSKEHRL